mgnify:CR=1 FL=1
MFRTPPGAGMEKGQRAGIATADMCRGFRLGRATFHRPKAVYGGMALSEATRQTPFEEGIAKLWPMQNLQMSC